MIEIPPDYTYCDGCCYCDGTEHWHTQSGGALPWWNRAIVWLLRRLPLKIESTYSPFKDGTTDEEIEDALNGKGA